MPVIKLTNDVLLSQDSIYGIKGIDTSNAISSTGVSTTETELTVDGYYTFTYSTGTYSTGYFYIDDVLIHTWGTGSAGSGVIGTYLISKGTKVKKETGLGTYNVNYIGFGVK